MRRLIPYREDLKQLARKLRGTGTLGEVLLWNKLKRGQFYGYRFIRQKPLLDFIVDFYCYELNLIIEIDGSSHNRNSVAQRDVQRETALGKYNLEVMRFTERQVRFERQDVLRSIEHYIRCYEEKH